MKVRSKRLCEIKCILEDRGDNRESKNLGACSIDCYLVDALCELAVPETASGDKLHRGLHALASSHGNDAGDGRSDKRQDQGMEGVEGAGGGKPPRGSGAVGSTKQPETTGTQGRQQESNGDNRNSMVTTEKQWRVFSY